MAQRTVAASSKLVDVNRERDKSPSNTTLRLRTLADGCTVVPAGESDVSGGGWLVEHHRTSVLIGLTIKRFEAIHLVMSSTKAKTRLAHTAVLLGSRTMSDVIRGNTPKILPQKRRE